ncbi:MAG: polysaccharide deacetylase family protein [Clostridiaceae bacterium]|nr:polysaccharide deacetylase family protein [Clostridiaceae bacterium]
MIVIRKRVLLFVFCAAAVLLLVLPVIVSRDIAVNAKVREIPIYSVEKNENKVSITFDCAWGADDIPIILNTLKEKNVKATFFLVGSWIEKNEEETRMIAEQGHDVANHSKNHFKMGVLGKEKVRSEIIDCGKLIEEITGKKTDLFRAPYGDYNDTVLTVARQEGYYNIQWSLDSLDWKPGITEEGILSRIENAKSGDILLFHNDTANTAKILGRVIDILKEKGLNPVPVSELIIRENFDIRHDGRQYKK